MVQNKISIFILLCGILAITLPHQLSVKADPDLWWHTLTGSIILENNSIPKTDLFSFTATGNKWINHEWLTDVIFAASWHIAKDTGLLILRMSLLTGISFFLVIAFINRWPNELIGLIFLAITLPVVNVFINVRPHSFTYFLIVVTIFLWDSWIAGKKRKIWALPVLMICWVNLHGGFLLGVAVSCIFVASIILGLEDPKTQPNLKDKIHLVTVLALTILATLVTPWGFELFRYLLKELGSRHSFISEWQGINNRTQVIFFLGYGIVPVVLYGFSRKWNKVTIPVMFVISAYSAWVHARFFVVMILFGSIMSIDAAGELFKKYHITQRWLEAFDRIRHPINLLIFVAIFMLASLYSHIWGQKNEAGFQLKAPIDYMPLNATAFLKEHHLGPNLAPGFNWNGFLLWHLYPQYKVAVDGRNLTVYHETWVDEYIYNYGSGTLTDYLSNYSVDVMLVGSGGKMDKALSVNPQWEEAYRDWQAVVYIPEGKDSFQRVKGPTQPAKEIYFFPGEVPCLN